MAGAAAPPDLDIYELPMVFDVTSGIYWRPGESGDKAVFPKGWTGTWELHETVRKAYSIF
ncbi:MAG: hypothetical protein QOF88_1908, partial [Mycobacterium sp.]|nr:hypothetical protein [Mycobacterium sp.]